MNNNVGNKWVWPQYNYFYALLKIAPFTWSSIFGAWLFVIISFAISFEVQASGAVLVCGALVAEIFYENLYCRKLHCDDLGNVELQRDMITGKPILWGAQVMLVSKNLEALLATAKPDEITNVRIGASIWQYKKAVKRVDKAVLTAIVSTAVLGTALWGYGHLLIK